MPLPSIIFIIVQNHICHCPVWVMPLSSIIYVIVQYHFYHSPVSFLSLSISFLSLSGIIFIIVQYHFYHCPVSFLPLSSLITEIIFYKEIDNMGSIRWGSHWTDQIHQCPTYLGSQLCHSEYALSQIGRVPLWSYWRLASYKLHHCHLRTFWYNFH